MRLNGVPGLGRSVSVHGKIIDCSPVTEIRSRAEDGSTLKTHEVSFYVVFPQFAPGRITSLMANQHLLPIDRKAVFREPFKGRWGASCDGFIVEKLDLLIFGGRIPEITGNARDMAAA